MCARLFPRSENFLQRFSAASAANQLCSDSIVTRARPFVNQSSSNELMLDCDNGADWFVATEALSLFWLGRERRGGG